MYVAGERDHKKGQQREEGEENGHENQIEAKCALLQTLQQFVHCNTATDYPATFQCNEIAKEK